MRLNSMSNNGEQSEKIDSITHSPYYGCVIRVVSKASVSYEGILDGISKEKDRIYLKNVRVNGNSNESSEKEKNSIVDFNDDSMSTVMIEHLTKDFHRYDRVCLKVRDVREVRLIELPSSFNEAREKLRSIDPCLIDIQLSSSDQKRNSKEKRSESFGSDGRSALISSSSNDSSLSFGILSNRSLTGEESNDESIDDQIEKFHQLKTNSKPATLLAKKILPKKINSNFTENRTNFSSNQQNTKKTFANNERRHNSPIRVTITSKLNPNAKPFFSQQNLPNNFNNFQRNSMNFHDFEKSNSLPNGINHFRNNRPVQQIRFNPTKNVFNRNIQRFTTNVPMATYRIQSDRRPMNNQQIQKRKPTTNFDFCHQTETNSRTNPIPIERSNRSSTSNFGVFVNLPMRKNESNTGELTPRSLLPHEPIGSNRFKRNFSTTSTDSHNFSLEKTFSKSLKQLETISDQFTLPEGQYDFEKANEEFRRYLELEELVIRRGSMNSAKSFSEDLLLQQISPETQSYKKDFSFFDRISCTATTGTAVAYAEIDEQEKNFETFGDDARLIGTTLIDDE